MLGKQITIKVLCAFFSSVPGSAKGWEFGPRRWRGRRGYVWANGEWWEVVCWTSQ